MDRPVAYARTVFLNHKYRGGLQAKSARNGAPVLEFADRVNAVPIMAVRLWLGTNPAILGKFTLTRRHQWLGWFATAVMAAAVVAMIAAWITG